MSTPIKYLRLYLHTPDGTPRAIGYLSAYGDIMRVSFDDDYIQDPQRPALSLNYRGATETDTRAILSAARDQRLTSNDGRWPAYFQNLLPEGHNRDRLAKARGCHKDDEFELLAAAGHDLMGAVEVQPVQRDEAIPQSVRHWHVAMGFEALEPALVDFPVEDAAALPGVVTKFSAIQEGRRYVVKRHGKAGSYILKLPSTRHPDLAEIEATGFVLCESLGLDCAHAQLITREQAELPEHIQFERLLAVKRFDRTDDGRRVHMEEFAQVLGYTPQQKYGKDMLRDYGQMLRVLDRFSSRPVPDTKAFLLRFVTYIVMGNTDAHLKNWALIYPDGVTPRLAPVYDPVCVSSFFAGAAPLDYAIHRAIDAKLSALSWDDVEGLMNAGGLRRTGHLLRQCKALVAQAKADWPALLKQAPPAMAAEVLSRLGGKVALCA
jgi:serine/threonine-protein kinase HipA